MKLTHPAKVLFKQLFDEVALEGRPQLPTHYVPRNWFHQKCREAGISVPENFIAALEWEESIGLPQYTHQIIAAHHRKYGTDFTPMEKGSWRRMQKAKRKALL